MKQDVQERIEFLRHQLLIKNIMKKDSTLGKQYEKELIILLNQNTKPEWEQPDIKEEIQRRYIRGEKIMNRTEYRIREIRQLLEYGLEKQDPTTAKQLKKELQELLEEQNNDTVKEFWEEQESR
ncbi:hypothetical protein [Methanosphaera sp.]